MINLLLLSAGTNANFQISKVLKTYFSDQIHIVGADINPKHLIATGIYLDSFYQVPMTKDSKYYPTILEICRKEKINYILPSFDTDQMLFFPENTDLINLGVKSFSTPEVTLKFYKNKALMNVFLKDNHFPIPHIYSQEECQDESIYMVKPINGVGSIGAGLKSGTEIKKMNNLKDFIIQEQLFEPELTMECFYLGGQFSCVCRERLATKAGVCTKARVFNNSLLAEIGRRFAVLLKTPPIFNLQFMQNKKGEYFITDVNLRTAGGMGLSYIVGWDEISALAKIMLNKDICEIFKTLPTTITESFVVRASEDIITKQEKKIIAFDCDGTILDSRIRHQTCLNDILAEYNIRLDTSDLVEFKSTGKNNIDYLISKGISEVQAKEIQTKWIENIEKEKYLAQDILYSDSIKLLEKYHKMGDDLILLTARNNMQGLQNQLDNFDLRRYFKEIFIVPSGKNTVNQKTEILKKQNAVLMIGDTLSDAKAAQHAGIKFQYHENGFHKKELFKKEIA